MTLDEMYAKLKASKKVTHVTKMRDGTTLLAHTRDGELASSLSEMGARVQWFDRTQYSTRSGKSKADMQAEITLGPRCFDTEETT